jgi:hypothetical protein
MKWFERGMMVASAIGLLTGVFAAIFVPVVTAQTTVRDQIIKNLTDHEHPLDGIAATAPTIDKPDWYFDVTLTYTVSKNGATTSDLSEFASLANATLNDDRGWSRLNVKFTQVASGGMFNLILSQASLVPTYSSGCSADWSCRVGNNVIINDDRWTGASAAWNSGGGSLRDYRHMVVNHEVGHWLGHDHRSCGGAGQSAPVMQQQSIDLQGCVFNPWPLSSELWSSRL